MEEKSTTVLCSGFNQTNAIALTISWRGRTVEWEVAFRKKSFGFISVLILNDCFCTQEELHSRVLPRSRWATRLPLLLLHCSWWLVIFKIQRAFSLAGIVLQESCDVLGDGDVDQCCQVLQSQNGLGITCFRKGNMAPLQHFSTVTCGSEQHPWHSLHLQCPRYRSTMGKHLVFLGFLMICRQRIYWWTSQAFINYA